MSLSPERRRQNRIAQRRQRQKRKEDKLYLEQLVRELRAEVFFLRSVLKNRADLGEFLAIVGDQ